MKELPANTCNELTSSTCTYKIRIFFLHNNNRGSNKSTTRDGRESRGEPSEKKVKNEDSHGIKACLLPLFMTPSLSFMDENRLIKRLNIFISSSTSSPYPDLCLCSALLKGKWKFISKSSTNKKQQ